MKEKECNYGGALEHAAVCADQFSYVQIDDVDVYEQLVNPRNHEKEAMRKVLYEKLSDEAKSVVALILNAPTEVVEELKKINLPGYQNYYNGWMQEDGFSSEDETAIFKKERLAVYLRKTWGKRILVRKVIGELEVYAIELGRI